MVYFVNTHAFNYSVVEGKAFLFSILIKHVHVTLQMSVTYFQAFCFIYKFFYSCVLLINLVDVISKDSTKFPVRIVFHITWVMQLNKGKTNKMIFEIDWISQLMSINVTAEITQFSDNLKG